MVQKLGPTRMQVRRSGFEYGVECMGAALQQLYIDVFGSDSDSEESDSHTQCRARRKPGESPAVLPGLTLQKAALGVLQQATLLATFGNKRRHCKMFLNSLARCSRTLS